MMVALIPWRAELDAKNVNMAKRHLGFYFPFLGATKDLSFNAF